MALTFDGGNRYKLEANLPRWEAGDLNKLRVLWFIGALAALIGLLSLSAACGGGEEDGEDGGPSAELELTALSTLFDKDELVAPAGQPLSVAIDNQDAGILHDFDIYELDAEGEVGDLVYDGELFEGIDTKTFTVPALKAGTHQFICSVHPATMVGTLTVE